MAILQINFIPTAGRNRGLDPEVEREFTSRVLPVLKAKIDYGYREGEELVVENGKHYRCIWQLVI